MRIITQTISGLVGPFTTLLLVQFTVFYVFNLVGVWKWGGILSYKNTIINGETPTDYVYCNFNDFFMGFMTLFDLMVVNNW